MSHTAIPHQAGSHHLDHPELLLLDNAVAHLAEQFITTARLTPSERAALDDYQADVDRLLTTLAGPAHDFAADLLDLAQTVLAGDAELRADSASQETAHRAA